MKSSKTPLFLLAVIAIILSACSDDEDITQTVQPPDAYSFERDGQSTVSFSGQTTRIQMANEMAAKFLDFSTTEEILLQQFRNEGANGEDVAPFNSADLNTATKSIRSKTAASRDYFSANATDAIAIRNEFESWIAGQINEVFPNENTVAEPGIAGQIADGSSTRYVNDQGLEYNQAFTKSLIGALMVDQMLNNYLSTSVLDEADNQATNTDEIVEAGSNYTTMEHKWDEAYGYLYGNAQNPADPNALLGEADDYLNKYLGRVEGNDDFTGIANDIFNAFALGRAAIVANDYELRDVQANIIRQKVSEIIGIRAVYYLINGKNALPDDRSNTALYGTTFHDLSEGYGFIYSLQFTRMPNSNQPYFTKAEVENMLADLMGDGPNGLWDVQETTLDQLAEEIAAKFEFTVAQAAS